MAAYGNKLDPYRSMRRAFGAKGLRTSVVLSNTPTTIDEKQPLLVNFPKLGPDDVIVPGSVRVAFTITLTNGDKGDPDINRTIVNNLGRAIVSKITVKLEGKDIQTIEYADRYLCFRDLWLTDKERVNASYQGIQNTNTGKIRVGAGDAVTTTQPDASIAAAYGNRFSIPLDFELLTDHMPFYQYGLEDQLSFELTFNDYGQVIVSANDTATYQIKNIALEFEKVTHEALAATVSRQLQGEIAILFTMIQGRSRKPLKKEVDVWNVDVSPTARSLKGVLLLFEDPAAGAMGPAFGRNSEHFYNPLIKTVSVCVDGQTNQLYSEKMHPYQHWDEIVKGFARGQQPSIDQTTYFHNRYGFWLDFRTSDDHGVHGSGRRVGSNAISIELKKPIQEAGVIYCYTYVLIDAQLKIGGGKLIEGQY